MILSTTLITPPTVEPVSLTLAKQHLRVDFSDDDAYITALITAAREFAEKRTNRAFFNQTWKMTMDYFPVWQVKTAFTPDQRKVWPYAAWSWDQLTIAFPHARLVSVTNISYLDPSGTKVVLDPSTYNVDASSTPGRVAPTQGSVWPIVDNYRPGSVEIDFVAGSYGDGVTSSAPASIQQAILLLIGHWYTNREAIGQANLTQLPLAVDALLSLHKVHKVGM